MGPPIASSWRSPTTSPVCRWIVVSGPTTISRNCELALLGDVLHGIVSVMEVPMFADMLAPNWLCAMVSMLLTSSVRQRRLSPLLNAQRYSGPRGRYTPYRRRRRRVHRTYWEALSDAEDCVSETSASARAAARDVRVVELENQRLSPRRLLEPALES
jgi:hypothetical protein